MDCYFAHDLDVIISKCILHQMETNKQKLVLNIMHFLLATQL
jgi:hypothetical protein